MKSSLLLVIALLSIASCKKSDVHVPDNLEISSTGTQLVGMPLSFSSNAGAGNSFLWDFGDSTTSSQPKPTHTYKTAGARSVRLTLNGNNKKVSVKILGVYYDPMYTSLASGTHTWRHFYSMDRYGYPQTNITYPDTSFEIRFVDQVTLQIGTVTMNYYPVSDSVLGFEYSHGGAFNNYDHLLYNHVSKSISFNKYRHIAASANSTEYYLSP